MTRFVDGRSEDGFSLVEILIAMTVMGIAIAGLLAAMGTSVRAAGLHRTQALAELEVRRYAELVEAVGYQEAGYTADLVGYDPPDTPPFDFKKIDPTFICIDAHGDPVGSCTGAPAQIVSVTVESVDGRVNETLEVVKRS